MLQVRNLTIAFGDAPPVVHDLSFSLARGEQLGLLGLSGSGKSLTAQALLGLLPRGGLITAGSAHYQTEGGEEIDLFRLPERGWRKMRGREISLVFQEPLTALNPTQRIKEQLREAVEQLRPEIAGGEATEDLLRNWLLRVELPVESHDRLLRAYPHELSGGQRQRLLIALALLAEPRLLIADEPTTALDTITEAAILRLLAKLYAELGMTMIFITHDLDVIRQVTQRALVLEHGRLIRQGPTAEVVARELVNSRQTTTTGQRPAAPHPAPATAPKKSAAAQQPVLRVDNLSVVYPGRKFFPWSKARDHAAVTDVSFTVAAGEWVALVGPSGCGKTTVARHLAGLLSATAGKVSVTGRPQLVFQDPYSTLNPRHSVSTILREVVRLSCGVKADVDWRITELLTAVGLDPERHADRLPAALSGGQRQRVAIARSLAANSSLLIADEAVSALDAPLRAEVLALLDGLRKERNLGLLFISHDLRLVADWADRVLIMDRGAIVEQGPTSVVLRAPQSNMGKRLLAASL